MGKVLIYCSQPEEREFLFKFAHTVGDVHTASTLDKARSLLETQAIDILLLDIADAAPGGDPLFLKPPCLILTGRREDKLKEAILLWPAGRFVDYILMSGKPEDVARSKRVIATADAHARLVEDLADLRQSKKSADSRMNLVSAQIKEIGSSLSGSLVRELEKRIAIEARYLRFQEQKRKIEDTLRKLYAANDVSNLLDITGDIKDLVKAEGISLYVREENEVLGKYLKPLVWDDAFLVHADFERHMTPLDAQDFAASVARTGQPLNIAHAESDPRCSRRYREQLRTPLRSLIAAPLRQDSEVVGLIEAVNKTGLPADREAGFSAEDLQILGGLSEHISLAMAKLNLIQYDALTGLLRPDPFFEKVIQKVAQRVKRRQETGIAALVMGDVDWFKAYNDRNGHEAGNRLLRDLSAVLKTSIRDEDLLCRYGGEEFLFFLSGVQSIEEATLLTDRIRRAVADRVFEFEEHQPRHDLTMSFGVTTFPLAMMGPGGPETKALLKKAAHEADLALAEAKGKPIGETRRLIGAPAKNKVCAFVRERAAVVTKTTLLGGPEPVPKKELRRFERHAASTLCIYRENGSHRVANTIDISLGGMKISSKTPLTPTRPLDLFLILGTQATPLGGLVVYSRKASPASAFFFSGIKFRGLTASDIEALEKYFSTLDRRGFTTF